MALLRNSLVIGLLAAAVAASPALAEDYTVNYMTHMDSITIGLGDAPQSNIEIQHPTPWPPYVNNTRIKTPAPIGTSALDSMFARYATGGTGSTAATTDTSGASGGSSTTTISTNMPAGN